MLRNTARHYGAMAKWLHWVVALLALTILSLGYYSTTTDDHTVLKNIFFFHKSLAVTLLPILLFRLMWRWFNPTPKHAGISGLQTLTATLVHYLLYIALFTMILSGWGMSSWGGHPVSFWGLNLALPVEIDKPLGHLLATIHLWAAWTLFCLIVLHLLAALYHHFFLRDNVLTGMLPQKKRSLFR